MFHIDFNAGNFKKTGALEEKINAYLHDWEDVYGQPEIKMGAGDRFARILHLAYVKTGRCCVVLIDEYDKPLLDVLETGLTTVVDGQERLLEEWHRDVLRGLYSVFKAADADLQFVLLTGVTKFSQVSAFSGFNQPKDISMDSRYDGYHFSEDMTDVYNPFSLLNVFDSLRMRDYWITTGTSDYLVRLLSRSDENIEEMLSSDYTATAEMPLPMIYQSGYLTIKGYDRDTELFRLVFPNEEIRRGFLAMLTSFSSRTGNIEDWKTEE